MNLSGNTILVTGGSVGIGLFLTRALVARGNRVLVCGRRKERLAQTKKELPTVETFACDVGTKKGRQELKAWALELAPALNVLVNNAGVQHRLDLTKGASDEAHRYEELAINLEAPIHLGDLFIPHLLAQEHAAIVNVTSGLAFTPFAAVPIYCATKAALHSYSMSLRHQLRATSVRVYEVAPPLVQSELHEHQGGVVPSNAGMPTDEFVAAAIDGLERDIETNLVGTATMFRDKPDQAFAMLNPT